MKIFDNILWSSRIRPTKLTNALFHFIIFVVGTECFLVVLISHPIQQLFYDAIPLSIFFGAKVPIRNKVDLKVETQRLSHTREQVDGKTLKAIVATSHEIVPLKHGEGLLLKHGEWGWLYNRYLITKSNLLKSVSFHACENPWRF